MTVSDFLQNVNDALRGTDDDAPTFGSDEASYWLRILNRKKRELYDDPSRTWVNTFDIRDVGSISATVTPSFDLDDDFIAPSDVVYVVTTDGQRYEYTVVKPQERDYYHREAYIAGQLPQTLYFSNAITDTESILNGTLYVPGYYMPDDVSGEAEELPFLLPDWGVMAVAAEVAENDIVYEDKSENLNNKANALFQQMEAKNKRGTFGNPRQIPTRANRIPGVF